MFGLGFGGQTRIAYTQDLNLHALEVTDLETRKRRDTASFFNGSKPEYPRRMHCIQGSDAHRISGSGKNLGVGERATEVQLPEMTFAALKEVFLGSDFTRTRPARRATEEPFDHVKSARDNGPTIVQSFHENMTRRGGCMHAILCDVVAFANTNGGTIYVGVSPNTKVAPKGVDDPNVAIKELEGEIDRLVYPPRRGEPVGADQRGQEHCAHQRASAGRISPMCWRAVNIYVRQEAETSLAMRDEIVQLIAAALGKGGAVIRRVQADLRPARAGQGAHACSRKSGRVAAERAEQASRRPRAQQPAATPAPARRARQAAAAPGSQTAH